MNLKFGEVCYRRDPTQTRAIRLWGIGGYAMWGDRDGYDSESRLCFAGTAKMISLRAEMTDRTGMDEDSERREG